MAKAPALGAGDSEFESRYPDMKRQTSLTEFVFLFCEKKFSCFLEMWYTQVTYKQT